MAQESIICVLDFQQFDVGDDVITKAQRFAITNRLPMTVVVCVPSVVELPMLINLEKELAKFDIPLMTLIGDLDSRLEGVKYHLNPKKIFWSNRKKSIVPKSLKRHPIKWPGRVAPVQELIDAKGMAC